MENTSGNRNSDNAIVRANDWKIVHIPDKPPVPPHLQPTVNVHAAVIEPKHANTLVRKLNQIVPLENLRHVKRVRKKQLDAGKCELSVILCLASESDGKLDGMHNEVLELIKQYQLSTFVAKIGKFAASTKEEWEEQCKFWPTSYHPPTYNISGITGFSGEDAQSVLCFMKNAVDLAKSNNKMVVNAAVIVDPSSKKVISSACDQVVPWTTPKSEASVATNCSGPPELTINGKASDMQKPQELFLGYSSCESKNSYNYVSCLHPWQWAQQQLTVNSCTWHPLRHAAMVAIEYSAARDRLLFPGNGQCGDEFIQEDDMLFLNTGLPSKRQKVNLSNDEDEDEDEENPECKANSFQSDSVRPYLCTGYDVYLVWEPCTMCAMALVHQRVKRIFYAFPNPTAGALGSVHRLQGERSLNHHYAVFRVLLPEDTIEDDNVVASASEKRSN